MIQFDVFICMLVLVKHFAENKLSYSFQIVELVQRDFNMESLVIALA